MPGVDMERFWDERAREDALYFVDNRLEYGRPDAERFWADGEAVLDRLLELGGVTVAPGDVVVDLGCGVGRLTRALAQRGATVRAVDVSREMLDRARALNPELEGVEWLHGDGVSLRPLADASADGCLSFVVLQHVPDPAVTLGYVGEMGRVLRPGGWAIFQVSTDPRVHRAPGVLARLRRAARAALGRGPRGQDHPAWRGAAVDPSALESAAADAGLRVQRLVAPGTQLSLVVARRS